CALPILFMTSAAPRNAACAPKTSSPASKKSAAPNNSMKPSLSCCGGVTCEAIPLHAEEGWLRQAKRRRRRGGQTGIPSISAELTTPALRATPPLRGGEYG